MPAGRKRTPKSPDRHDDQEPPALSQQPCRETAKNPGADEREFERFVRETLVEIRDAQASINQRIDRLEANFNTSMEFESKRITNLEQKTKELEKLTAQVLQAQETLTKHAEQLNKLERFSRRNNIRIIGLPQDKNEDCLALTTKILEEKFDLHNIKLERAHRDGPKIQGRPQHLLAKVNCYQDKVNILRKQRQVLADVPYFCVEDLTRQDLQEKRLWSSQVSKAYQEGKKYRFVAGKWRDHGGVLAAFYRG